jgi:thiamine-monophosphate kinase
LSQARAGARAGDELAVAGALGLAAAGIEALRSGRHGTSVERAIAAYRRPRALIEEGLAAVSRAHSAIDVSDGLALDASRLALESGVAIVLEADQVQAAGGPELRAAASTLALDPLELALHGGDDYALLMAFPPGELPRPFMAIGSCRAGAGVLLRAADGSERPLEPRGYDHFGA